MECDSTEKINNKEERKGQMLLVTERLVTSDLFTLFTKYLYLLYIVDLIE